MRVLQLEQAEAERLLYDAELTKAKEKAEDCEKKFQNLFNNSPFGIVICQILSDEDGNFIDFIHVEANQSTEGNTGFDVKNLIGAKASDMVDKKTLDELVSLYGSVILTGQPISYEQHFEVYDRTLNVTAFPLFENLFIINFINTTERKLSEAALRLSEEKFRGIYEQSPIAIQLYDNAGKLVDVNAQTLHIYGLKDKKYILGYDMWSSLHFTPETEENVKRGRPVYD